MGEKNYSEERESFQVVAWLAGILCLALLVFLAIPASDRAGEPADHSTEDLIPEAETPEVPLEDQAFFGARYIADNIAKILERRIEIACEAGEPVESCSDSEHLTRPCHQLVRRFYSGPFLGNFRFEVVVQSVPNLNCKLKHFCMSSDTIGEKFLYYRPGASEILVSNVPCKALLAELDSQEAN